MFQKGFLNCIIWIDHRHTTKPSSIVLHITTARTTSVFSVMPQMIIDVVIQTSSITLSDPCWMLLFSNHGTISSFPPTTGENKLAKLRRCVSREHFAKIYFAKYTLGKYTLEIKDWKLSENISRPMVCGRSVTVQRQHHSGNLKVSQTYGPTCRGRCWRCLQI